MSLSQHSSSLSKGNHENHTIIEWKWSNGDKYEKSSRYSKTEKMVDTDGLSNDSYNGTQISNLYKSQVACGNTNNSPSINLIANTLTNLNPSTYRHQSQQLMRQRLHLASCALQLPRRSVRDRELARQLMLYRPA